MLQHQELVDILGQILKNTNTFVNNTKEPQGEDKSFILDKAINKLFRLH